MLQLGSRDIEVLSIHSELQKAFEEAAKLSDDEEALEHWLFEEIDSERRWDEFFLRSYESLAALGKKLWRSIAQVAPRILIPTSGDLEDHSELSNRTRHYIMQTRLPGF